MVVGEAEHSTPLSSLDKAWATAQQGPLWVLQSIAAFPLRNEHTHAAVYLFFLILFGTLVVTALRMGGGRGRFGLLVAAALALLVPAAVTYTTVETFGTAWQGRYTLPYSLGIVLIAGMLLDRRAPGTRTDALLGGGVLYVVAQATGPLILVVHERLISPGVDNGAWILVPPTLLGLLAVAGASLLWLGAAFVHDGGIEPEDGSREELSHDRPHRARVAVGADR
jgi:DMSO reductase anchor subunit